MRRSLDWRRHPLLVASVVVLTGVLVLEVGGAVTAAALVPEGLEYEEALAPVFRHCTQQADLTDLGRPSPGAGTELLDTVRLKRGESIDGLMRSIEEAVAGHPDGR